MTRTARSPLLALAGTALLASGCGAIGGRWAREDFSRNPGVSLFLGVRTDALFLGGSTSEKAGWAFLLAFPAVLLDLPLSLAVDLILAPVDLAEYLGDRWPADAPRSVEPSAPRPSGEVLDAPWSLLVGGETTPAMLGRGLVGSEVAKAVSASVTGRLRLAETGGVRQLRTPGAHPATTGAAIDPEGGALIGFGRQLLEAPASWLPAGASAWSAPASAGRILDVVRAGPGRALVTTRRSTFLLSRGPLGWTDHGDLAGGDRPLAAASSPGGLRLAVGDEQGHVGLLELAAELGPGMQSLTRPILILTPPGSRGWWVTALAFEGEDALWVGHADGELVRWSLDGSEVVWVRDVDDRGEHWTYDVDAPPLSRVLRGRDDGAILALAVRGDLVASAGGSNVVTLRRDGVAPVRLTLDGLGEAGPVVDLTFSPDGRELLVAALDGVVRRLDLATRREVDRIDLRPIEDRPRRVAFLADGGVAVVTERGTLLRFAPE